MSLFNTDNKKLFYTDYIKSPFYSKDVTPFTKYKIFSFESPYEKYKPNPQDYFKKDRIIQTKVTERDKFSNLENPWRKYKSDIDYKKFHKNKIEIRRIQNLKKRYFNKEEEF